MFVFHNPTLVSVTGSDGRLRALTNFKLEGEVTSLSESSQGEVGETE